MQLPVKVAMVHPGSSVEYDSPELYWFVVCSVNICWYELSLLDRSAEWARWDLELLRSKSCASTKVITLGPTCNFSFDLQNHAYLLAGMCKALGIRIPIISSILRPKINPKFRNSSGYSGYSALVTQSYPKMLDEDSTAKSGRGSMWPSCKKWSVQRRKYFE